MTNDPGSGLSREATLDPFLEMPTLWWPPDGVTDAHEPTRPLPPPTPGGDEGRAAPQPTLIARHWLIVAVLMLFAGGASVGVTMWRWQTTWDASVLVRVGRPGVFADQFTDPAYVERILNTVAELSSGDAVKDSTWKQAGLDPSAESNTLTVEVVRESELLRFHVTDHDAGRAEKTLAAFVVEAQGAVQDVYQDNLAFVPTGDTHVAKVAPPVILRGALGAATGLLLGLGFAAILDRRRR